MRSKNKFGTPKTLISLIVLFLLATGITSCNKSDNAGSLQLPSYVTPINANSTSQPQDFSIDNTVVNSGISYTHLTGYLAFNFGNHQITFKDAGTSTINATGSLNATNVNYYTVFYTDDKSIATFQDDRSATQTGQSRVRFINLSVVPNQTISFGVVGGTMLTGGLGYKTASPYYDITAGTTFNLYIGASTTVVLNIPVTIDANHLYTIYITGTSASNLTYHLVLQDT